MIRSLQLLLIFLTTTASFINLKSFTPILRKTYLCNSYLNDINTNSTNFFNYNITPPLLAKPIPKISFDNLFLNLFSVTEVYLSSNCDRIIIDYNNKKGVYYIMNNTDKKKITYLLSLIDVKTNIVGDYLTRMNDKSGSLYCSPNYYIHNNITKDEIEDIINGIIHKNDISSEDSYDYLDDDDIMI